MTTPLLFSLVGMGALLGAEGRAHACERAEVAGDVSALPPAWRAELLALLDATGDASQPWGCPGGTVALSIQDERATLRVERPGAAMMTRQLGAPSDVVPTGKALLARSTPAAAPPEPSVPFAMPRAEPPGADRPAHAPVPLAGPDVEPRAFVAAAGLARYAGAADLVALGGVARAGLPFGRWSAGLRVRYAVLAAELGATAPDFDFTELAIGGGIGYAVVPSPVRVHAELYGAMAVVDMEAESLAAGREEVEVESGVVDGRLGIEARLSVPLSDVFHVVVAADADVSPASLGDADRRLDPLLPALPVYTIGLSTGLEVAIP